MNNAPTNSRKHPGGAPGSTEDFRAALKDDFPPSIWNDPFKALWWDARGHWESAHQIAQDLPTSWGAWMHAYLHRKEGDLWNAGYWYRKAGVREWRDSPEAEFEALLQAALDADGKAF